MTSLELPAIAPITLTGKYVVLEPLSPDHHDGLVEAARDGELWEPLVHVRARPGADGRRD